MRHNLRTLTLAILAGTCAAGNLWAQAAPAPPGATRIGMVNLGILFREQEKVKNLRSSLDAKLKPFEDKSKELEKIIVAWNKRLREPGDKVSDKEREEGNAIIVQCRRRMEDLEKEYHDGIGGEVGCELVVLDKEIRQAIKLFAEARGYHLILAYGEPEQPLPPLKEFARRMTAIDAGNISFVPLEDSAQCDVTQGVLDLLNSSYRASLGVRPK